MDLVKIRPIIIISEGVSYVNRGDGTEGTLHYTITAESKPLMMDFDFAYRKTEPLSEEAISLSGLEKHFR